jgi:hypothetical protein
LSVQSVHENVDALERALGEIPADQTRDWSRRTHALNRGPFWQFSVAIEAL